MSTGKLDQSLDDIVKTNRPRRVVHHRRVVKSTKTEAPAGGVSKKARPAKGNKANSAAAKAVSKNEAIVPVSQKRESKIVVTGLPSDVTQQQIKEYFAKTIAPVRKALLTYGPDGKSRGVATVIFTKAGSAMEAATNLNGVKVDNRAMKIEVVVGADQTSGAANTKGLGDRISQPKNQTKKAEAKANTKSTAKSAAKPAAKKGKALKGRGNARPKTKTAEELDAEMTDYFGDGTTANGAAGQDTAVNGNAVEDEIM